MKRRGFARSKGPDALSCGPSRSSPGGWARSNYLKTCPITHSICEREKAHSESRSFSKETHAQAFKNFTRISNRARCSGL